jgi:glucose-1-phosphate adenylyltransferase
VIGVRSRIGRGVTIRNSILMGTDTYETPEEAQRATAAGEPLVGIGDESHIEGAIIDKNCRIGRGVRIANDRGAEQSGETPEAMIVDGIVVVKKAAVLPDGWRP